jgi:hypothetical protein
MIVLLLVCMTAFLTGCGSKELTRSRAADIIKTSEEFKKAATINLLPEYRQSLTLVGAGSREMSKEDFALQRFLESHADLAVLHHLGLVDFKVRRIEYPDSASSPLTVSSAITEKGRSASASWRQSGEGWVIPIATKELVEVTGLAGAEEGSKQARVDYTWKWQPTNSGAIFDTSSEAYQNLPASIRQNIGDASVADMMGNQGRVLFFDGSKTQKSATTLQLYDDGWRVSDR